MVADWFLYQLAAVRPALCVSGVVLFAVDSARSSWEAARSTAEPLIVLLKICFQRCRSRR
jgi:hypothetical protein